MTGCAYRVGSPDRSLPGGYKQIRVPLFQNKTMEPGVEVSFTNALRQEFERSKIARLSRDEEAEVYIEGSILSAQSVLGSPASSGDKLVDDKVVLATTYRVYVSVDAKLRRQSDNQILWQGTFSGETSYAAPRIFSPVLNSANPIYNLSSRRQAIESLSVELMSEAHDRMTENF